MRWPKAFVVTGTDTGVGKTVVSALLTCALEGSYWKPIQAGVEDGTDTRRVRAWTGLPEEHFFPEVYCLQVPASPHRAAELEGVTIDTSKIACPEVVHAPLVIEGAGGLLVPLNNHTLLVDLLELPVVLVARSGLGTINHTLLSLEALRRRSIPVLGVVMNGIPNASNRRAIEMFGDVDVLAELPPLERLCPETFEYAYQHYFWKGVENATCREERIPALAP